MSTPKPIASKSTRKIQSLEGAILRALAGPQPISPVASTAALRMARADKVATKPPASNKSREVPTAAEQATREKMARQARALREQLAKAGLVHVETVRLRPQGSVDRRLIVEVSPDPEDDSSILLRVRPATTAPLPAAGPSMLTTQEAADLLNVSRPYVAQLVDGGRFQGVQRTQSGHRRIPLVEVERVQQEMRSVRRAALDSMADATRDRRESELLAAKSKAKRRWVAKPT